MLLSRSISERHLASPPHDSVTETKLDEDYATATNMGTHRSHGHEGKEARQLRKGVRRSREGVILREEERAWVR